MEDRTKKGLGSVKNKLEMSEKLIHQTRQYIVSNESPRNLKKSDAYATVIHRRKKS